MKSMDDHSSSSDSEYDETYPTNECARPKTPPSASKETAQIVVLEAKALKHNRAHKSKPKRSKKSTSSNSSMTSSNSSTSAAASSINSDTTVAAVDPTVSHPTMSSATANATATASETPAPSADLVVLDEFNFDAPSKSPISSECNCSLCSLLFEVLCMLTTLPF